MPDRKPIDDAEKAARAAQRKKQNEAAKVVGEAIFAGIKNNRTLNAENMLMDVLTTHLTRRGTLKTPRPAEGAAETAKTEGGAKPDGGE